MDSLIWIPSHCSTYALELANGNWEAEVTFLTTLQSDTPTASAATELAVPSVRDFIKNANLSPGALIQLSIAKWSAIREAMLYLQTKRPNWAGYYTDGASITCALCWTFNAQTLPVHDCTGCPVFKATGERWCANTPYADKISLLGKRGNAEAYRVWAEKEQDFMIHLSYAEAGGFSCGTCHFGKYHPSLHGWREHPSDPAYYSCAAACGNHLADQVDSAHAGNPFNCDCYRMAGPEHPSWHDDDPYPF